ncbi:hypothetical protein [Marinobacter sp. F3R11]|uniref:hypothetical protein n=1 Tax=Marinobacter sp. F3R11 TaxID=2267231 RepID=UPI000DE8A01B|nr:hypothetical protein [Marinobacter sp. F3R11]RBW48909.1 hypothetical protein DS878_12285 [Marinobacter sp. F3R11]
MEIVMFTRGVKLVDFYCSDHGKAISNADLYQDIEKTVLPTLSDESRKLYQKLLLDNPERSRHVTHDIAYIASITDRSERLKLYEESIRGLMVDAVAGLFKQAGVGPDNIDFIVVTSSVGKTMPSAASIIASEFGFASKTVTLNLGDMACSSGLAAVDAGVRFLRSERAPKRCLVVALEAVTNLFNQSEYGVVPNVVFGEGAAAILLSTHREPAKYAIKESVRTIAAHKEAYEVIRFTENEKGPSIRLSRELPQVAAGAIKDNLQQFVPRVVSPWDKLRFLVTKKIPDWQNRLEYWALHPGGTAVLNGLARNLKLAQGNLAFSFRVFDQRSNMSSPSIFYVLREIEMHGPKKRDRVLMMSFGSGFKVNTMLMKRLSSARPERSVVIELKAMNGQLHCHTRQQSSGSETATDNLFQADLATLDPKVIANDVWKRTLGVNQFRICPSVSRDLSSERYRSLVQELRGLLMPKGSLTEL